MLDQSSKIPFLQTKKFLFLVLFFVALRMACTLLFSNQPLATLVDTYVYSHYLLSYELGFITRGLVGTVFNYLFPLLNRPAFLLIVVLFPVGIYLGMAVGFVKMVRRSENQRILLLLGLLFFSLPLTFLPFRDIGRFDILLYSIMLLSILAIYSRPESRLKWSLLLLLPIGGLIHEVFYFMFIPSILVLLLLKSEKGNAENKILFSLLAVILGILFLLLFFAQQNIPAWTELSKYLRENNVLNYNPPDSEEMSLDCYSGRTFFGHLSFVYHFYMDSATPYGFALLWSIPAMAPLFYLLYRTWRTVLRQLYRNGVAGKFLLFLLCAAPQSALLMVVIGIDFSRWIWAWIFSNFTLLFLLFTDRQFPLSYDDEKSGSLYPGASLFYLLIGQGSIFTFSSLTYILGLLTLNLVHYFGWL